MDMKGVSAYPRTALDPSFRTGLILCGMGGPEGPNAVEPVMREVFGDPGIFPVPRLLAPLIGAMIARKRSASVAERYLLMDPAGATPQLKYTRDQADLLARLADRLDRRSLEILSLHCQDGLSQAEVAGLLKVSRRTVGKRLAKARRLIEALGLDNADGVVRASFVHYTAPEEVDRLIGALDALLP